MACCSRIKSFELSKKPPQIFWLDPNTGIPHLHLEIPLVQPFRAYLYAATLVGELYGVGQKIIDNLFKFLLIKCRHLQSPINGHGQTDLLEIGHSFYYRGCFFQCLANQELFRMHFHLPSLQDRKSTRLNSSHSQISYAVFCLKKKK